MLKRIKTKYILKYTKSGLFLCFRAIIYFLILNILLTHNKFNLENLTHEHDHLNCFLLLKQYFQLSLHIYFVYEMGFQISNQIFERQAHFVSFKENE